MSNNKEVHIKVKNCEPQKSDFDSSHCLLPRHENAPWFHILKAVAKGPQSCCRASCVCRSRKSSPVLSSKPGSNPLSVSANTNEVEQRSSCLHDCCWQSAVCVTTLTASSCRPSTRLERWREISLWRSSFRLKVGEVECGSHGARLQRRLFIRLNGRQYAALHCTLLELAARATEAEPEWKHPLQLTELDRFSHVVF